jgi:excisionase family DNA binding protein
MPDPMTPTTRPLLTRAAVAGLFGVDPTTVTRWADQGVLPAVRTAGGHRRYPREAVRALLAARMRDAKAVRLCVREIGPEPMDEWVEEWRRRIGPSRHERGFEVLGAWLDRERGRLLWVTAGTAEGGDEGGCACVAVECVWP